MTEEFKQNTANIAIIIINVLVEAHHFIDMVEYYHKLLR